jgi:hypothetical protein
MLFKLFENSLQNNGSYCDILINAYKYFDHIHPSPTILPCLHKGEYLGRGRFSLKSELLLITLAAVMLGLDNMEVSVDTRR